MVLLQNFEESCTTQHLATGDLLDLDVYSSVAYQLRW